MSPVYELENLRYRYGETEVLGIEHLRITANRVTAIVGPNGAGKSTLMRLLAFVDAPSGGAIHFLGERVAGTPVAVRRRVALVPQNPYLLRDTVARNVEAGLRIRRVGAPARRDRADAMLSQLGLLRYRDRPASSLSGGERQKLAIGRALVLEPEVLLLDEPFSHLDARTEAELRSLIARIGEAGVQSVVFTTHNLAYAHAVAAEVHAIVRGRRHDRPLLNLYPGRFDPRSGLFDTGQVALPVGTDAGDGDLLSIDPRRVGLSRGGNGETGLPTARIVALQDTGREVQVTVDIGGETLHLLREGVVVDGSPLLLGENVGISFEEGALRLL